MEKVLLKCSQCQAVKETKLTPKGQPRIQSQWGWKRREDGIYCKECWNNQYRRLAIVLPIRPLDTTWTELRPILAQMWSHSTGLANWALSRLVQHDAVRVPRDGKLLPF